MSTTLNALVQLLTTAAQFLVTIPIFRALSQLKWLWFSSGTRSLASFQIYDDASRGGLGSWKLLFGLGSGGVFDR